jgi:hypothetical protein
MAMNEVTPDPVATFARIMRLIGKWLLFGLLILIALCAAIAGALYFYGWYSYDRHVSQVEMFVSTDKTACADDRFPIGVLVGNKSSKVLEKVTFRLEAREKGRSTDLARYHSYSDDHIMEPGTGYQLCWAVPELTTRVADPRALIWTIDSKQFQFR